MRGPSPFSIFFFLRLNRPRFPDKTRHALIIPYAGQVIPFRILFKTDDAEATVGAGTAANAALAQTNEMNLAVRENDGFF